MFLGWWQTCRWSSMLIWRIFFRAGDISKEGWLMRSTGCYFDNWKYLNCKKEDWFFRLYPCDKRKVQDCSTPPYVKANFVWYFFFGTYAFHRILWNKGYSSCLFMDVLYRLFWTRTCSCTIMATWKFWIGCNKFATNTKTRVYCVGSNNICRRQISSESNQSNSLSMILRPVKRHPYKRINRVDVKNLLEHLSSSLCTIWRLELTS